MPRIWISPYARFPLPSLLTGEGRGGGGARTVLTSSRRHRRRRPLPSLSPLLRTNLASATRPGCLSSSSSSSSTGSPSTTTPPTTVDTTTHASTPVTMTTAPVPGAQRTPSTTLVPAAPAARAPVSLLSPRASNTSSTPPLVELEALMSRILVSPVTPEKQAFLNALKTVFSNPDVRAHLQTHSIDNTMLQTALRNHPHLPYGAQVHITTFTAVMQKFWPTVQIRARWGRLFPIEIHGTVHLSPIAETRPVPNVTKPLSTLLVRVTSMRECFTLLHPRLSRCLIVWSDWVACCFCVLVRLARPNVRRRRRFQSPCSPRTTLTMTNTWTPISHRYERSDTCQQRLFRPFSSLTVDGPRVSVS